MLDYTNLFSPNDYEKNDKIIILQLLDVFQFRITSSAIGLKICAVAAGIKKYQAIIKKKKHTKRVLLAKSKLNSIEVLSSKSLIDPSISHDEFVLINNVLKENANMQDEIKNLKT